MSHVVSQAVQEAYDAVLKHANHVLRQCKLFSLEALREENPTIGEIAHSMRVICGLLETLLSAGVELEDCRIPSKAREYAGHIQAIAHAVDAEDEDELARQVAILNGRSFL